MENKAWTGKKPAARPEETVNVLEQLSWTVQPPLGLIKGEYYREENCFTPHYATDPGYRGVLEVVREGEQLVHVEFSEFTSPSYYRQMYQNASKRRSSYCFYQATKARTAQTLTVLDNGITRVEQQMLDRNSLKGPFDLVTGASNSVKRSMLPLANKIDAMLGEASGKRYYGIAEQAAGGLTPWLQVVVEKGRIVRCFYDEVFADRPEDIADPTHQPYYRQSKYESLEYEPAYPDGFNALSDLLEQRVLLTQNLLDLSGLPWTVDTELRPRNPEWDRYLALAEKLQQEMEQDGAL